MVEVPGFKTGKKKYEVKCKKVLIMQDLNYQVDDALYISKRDPELCCCARLFGLFSPSCEIWKS